MSDAQAKTEATRVQSGDDAPLQQSSKVALPSCAKLLAWPPKEACRMADANHWTIIRHGSCGGFTLDTGAVLGILCLSNTLVVR